MWQGELSARSLQGCQQAGEAAGLVPSWQLGPEQEMCRWTRVAGMGAEGHVSIRSFIHSFTYGTHFNECLLCTKYSSHWDTSVSKSPAPLELTCQWGMMTRRGQTQNMGRWFGYEEK